MSNFTDIIDGARGSAQTRVGTTVQTLAISVSAGFVLFGVQFTVFLIIRNYLWAKRIYQPRSFLIPLKDRVKPPPNNPFKWLKTIFTLPENPEILQKAGMDAYFFIRYLRMCLKIFLPMTLVILPILIPLHVCGGKGTNAIDAFNTTRYNVTGLDVMAWSNIPPTHKDRYWAHLLLAVGVVAWVCYVFYTELMNFIIKRQEYLGSRSHRLKASCTTVLITDIPKEVCNTESLTEFYDDFPGGIRRLWINRNFESLVEKDKRRRYLEDRLENAETNMIRKIVKHGSKAKSNPLGNVNEQTLSSQVTEELRTNIKTLSRVETREPVAVKDLEDDLQYDLRTNAKWTAYIDPGKRATMRIPKDNRKALFAIPIIGLFFSTKVDTIYYCRREVARLNKEIEYEMESQDEYPRNGSAFIQFNTQKAAHLACQAVADGRPQQMTQRAVEMSPADINWSALNLSTRARFFRLLLFLSLFVLVAFVFGVISFMTGILSRLSGLAGSTEWLRWVSSLPSWLLSFIQGTLPPVILVIVLSGPTPIVLRMLTNSTRGATTGSEGERSLQLWYFILLLLELVIIPTISAGLTSVVQELIHTPTTVPNILAENLPTASNYYFSFLILQTLSFSATSILQTVRLFNFYVIGGANTPDDVYQKLTFTHLTRIGSNIPWYTTFAIIGLVYCIIAPLMIVFVIITFFLFFIVVKNNLTYVVRTGNVDGGGLFFPTAINQTFTGIYIMEICLIGLFFLVRDPEGHVACEVQGIIMAIVFILTMLYQIWLSYHFGGLYKYAPVRLESEASKRDQEYELECLTKQDQEPLDTAEKDDQFEVLSTDEVVLSDEEPSSRLRPAKPKRQSSSRSQTMAEITRRSANIEAKKRRDSATAKEILAKLNRPLDEARLAELENRLVAAEARKGNSLVPRRKDVEAQMMNDPISKIIMQHNDELEDLDDDERDMLISVAFTHPVLRDSKPAVWIPQDDLGISDDEIRRTRELSDDIVIENRGAYFNKKLKVVVDKPPPNMSQFALIMHEL